MPSEWERKDDVTHDKVLECFICKAPLKRIKLNEYTFECVNISLGDELYECKKCHVFSSVGLIELEAYL